MKNLIDFLKFLKSPTASNNLPSSVMQRVENMLSDNAKSDAPAADLSEEKKLLLSSIPDFTTNVAEAIAIALEVESQFNNMLTTGPTREQLLLKLQNKTKELNEFSYIISHDLKAPLRAISSLTLWLKSDYGDKFDAEGQQFLELLLDRVSKMDKLIDCILQFSRVSNLNEVKANIDLNVLITGIEAFLKVPEAIKITIDNVLPVINAGEKAITHVFHHLLGNAIKYMGKPDGSIHIGAETAGNLWSIYVKDDGPGIDAKYHEKIFEIFQTLQNNDSEEIAGMGLTIVKKVVEANDGKAWVESTPGAGAKFIFTWPK